MNLPSVRSDPALVQAPQSGIDTRDIIRLGNAWGGVASNFQDAVDSLGTPLAEHAANMSVTRDANGNVQVAPAPFLPGKLGDVYSHTQATAFAVNMEQSVSDQISNLAQKTFLPAEQGGFGGDVSLFQKAANGLVQTVASKQHGYQDQTLAMGNQYVSQTARSLQNQRFQMDTANAKDSILAKISALDDDNSSLAFSNYNGPEMKAGLAKMKALYDTLGMDPRMGMPPDVIKAELDKKTSQYQALSIVGQAHNLLLSGNVKGAQELSDRLVTDKTLSGLSFSNRRTYSNIVVEEIRGAKAAKKVDLEPILKDADRQIETLKTGNGLNDQTYYSTIQQLAQNGSLVPEAIPKLLEMQRAHDNAISIQQIRHSPPDERMNMAERDLASVNGGGKLISAIINTESGGNPNTPNSPKGAAGLMQVMPDTGTEIARELGDRNFPMNGTDAQKQAYLQQPNISVQYGTHLVDKLMTRYGGDREAALIAYNAGPGVANRWLASGRDDSVLPEETKAYRTKIISQVQDSTPIYQASDVQSARTFLMGRTDKGADAINGLKDGLAVKLSQLYQAAPPEIQKGLGVYSGFRTNERQQEPWNAAVKKYGGPDNARKWVAPPGHSQHNSGGAADLSYNGQSLKNAPPEVVSWLHANAAKYGLTFPLNNENWHIEEIGGRSGHPSEMASGPRIDPEIIKEHMSQATNSLQNQFSTIETSLKNGGEFGADTLQEINRQLAISDDQGMRDKYSKLFMQAEATGALNSIPPADREAMIADMKAQSSNGGTVAQAELTSFATEKNNNIQKRLNDDPIGYAAERKLIPQAPVFDAQHPNTWADTMVQSQRAVDLLKARNEVGIIPAFRPEQAEAVAGIYRNGSADQIMALTNVMAAKLSPETLVATLTNGPIKEAITGAMQSTDPAKYGAAMQQLDVLSQKTSLAKLEASYNKDTVDRLQDWQAKVRYFTPDEAKDWLKQRNSPEWEERVKPLVAKGKEEARKVDIDSIIKKLDGALVLDANAPIDADSKRMLLNDYTELVGDRNGALADVGKSQTQAYDRLKAKWGVTSAYGDMRGRVMLYPPEKFYPQVDGKFDYIAGEMADIAKSQNVDVSHLSLVPDQKTEQAIQRNEAPGYLVSIVDPATGHEDLMHDANGNVLRHFFDPKAGQAKALTQAVQDRAARNDPWLVLGPNTAVGPFNPPDVKATERRTKEIYDQQMKAHQAGNEQSDPTVDPMGNVVGGN